MSLVQFFCIGVRSSPPSLSLTMADHSVCSLTRVLMSFLSFQHNFISWVFRSDRLSWALCLCNGYCTAAHNTIMASCYYNIILCRTKICCHHRGNRERRHRLVVMEQRTFSFCPCIILTHIELLVLICGAIMDI